MGRSLQELPETPAGVNHFVSDFLTRVLVDGTIGSEGEDVLAIAARAYGVKEHLTNDPEGIPRHIGEAGRRAITSRPRWRSQQELQDAWARVSDLPMAWPELVKLKKW